jgi:hypothetical protein
MMLRTEFEKELGRLACLRWPPVDTEGHYTTLKDMPFADFHAAVTLALKSRSEFPTVAELLNDADAANRRPSTVIPFLQSVKLKTPVKIQLPWTYTDKERTALKAKYGQEPKDYLLITHERAPSDCDRCNDSGWEEFQCPGDHRCGMPSCATTKYKHSYAKKCACWETNPVLIYEREQKRQYAVHESTKRRR